MAGMGSEAGLPTGATTGSVGGVGVIGGGGEGGAMQCSVKNLVLESICLTVLTWNKFSHPLPWYDLMM